MAEENKEVENKADADAGEKIDKVLSHLDSIMSACDSLSKRMDAYEEEKKADAEEKEAEEKAKKDAEEGEEVKADKKKDAEAGDGKDLPKEDKPEPLAADSKKDEEEEKKADSEDVRRLIADLEKRLPRVMSDAEKVQLADAQERADAVFHALGQRAPMPMEGETIERYRRRLATKLKVHSTRLKDLDLNSEVNEKTFSFLEDQVYADALEAARNPVDLGEDELRQITRVDPSTGLRQNTFVGKHTFINSMKRAPRYVVGINTARNSH